MPMFWYALARSRGSFISPSAFLVEIDRFLLLPLVLIVDCQGEICRGIGRVRSDDRSIMCQCLITMPLFRHNSGDHIVRNPVVAGDL